MNNNLFESSSKNFNFPKSRSKLHHHHQLQQQSNHSNQIQNQNQFQSQYQLKHQHQYHHQHQSSWSSSLSAFSLQRSSAFLIDEYGNQHDPEHCHFKTLATSPSNQSRSSSSSSSNLSITSSPPHSIRSLDLNPLPISLNHNLQLINSNQKHASTWSNLKRCRQNKFKQTQNHHLSNQTDPNASQNHHPCSKWTIKIWSHLLKPSCTIPTPTHSSIHSNHPSKMTRSLDSIANLSFNHSNQIPSNTLFKRKRKISITSPDYQSPPISNYPQRYHHQHLLGMRKRLELIKLEFRFGILRTRKRFVGVWKK